jgi:CHAT domain-containing protein
MHGCAQILVVATLAAPFATFLNANKPPSPQALLANGLRLADLFNWSAAASDFAQARSQFTMAGDKSNALWAEIGEIRSTIDTRNLYTTATDLQTQLTNNPILKHNKPLRMFCLAVKGDVDQEIDSRLMRTDWEQVQILARELGDAKAQNRALAELGIAAFYSGDLKTARQNVGTALAVATRDHDIGAEIRYTAVLGAALVSVKMFQESLPYFDQALLLAGKTPDLGYPFFISEQKMGALFGLNQLPAAKALAAEMQNESERSHQLPEQAVSLVWVARLDLVAGNTSGAITALNKSIAIDKAKGYQQTLPESQALMSDIYREQGNFGLAERYAKEAASVAQSSGDTWSVPERLQTLARLQVSQQHFVQADQTYNRADAFVDAALANGSSLLEKTALIKASSEMYAEHFSLVAGHLNDVPKAFAIAEQVRGRITADLLADGSVSSDRAGRTEHAISKLQLSLMAAKSTDQVQRIRSDIFTLEQARWVTPTVNELRGHLRETIMIGQVQHSLSSSAVILEYVLAEPKSYCLVITSTAAHIVSLAGRSQVESLISSYVGEVKKRHAAHHEALALYSALIEPIPEAVKNETLVVVRDGQLNLVPFDAFEDSSGHYVVESHQVAYVPSAASFYLMVKQDHKPRVVAHSLLAVGGIAYKTSSLRRDNGVGGADAPRFENLPNSAAEMKMADSAFNVHTETNLLGPEATESAFKKLDLSSYRIIHLAVHGVADEANPDHAALILLPNSAAGDDGFLQASEVVMLKFNADVVVLSACDTAVGPIQGQEGVSNLSKAFLLAGAHSVVSTLWSVDDNSSLPLMQDFYNHLAVHGSTADALTIAKRKMLQKYGKATVPFYWAEFIFEGVPESAIAIHKNEKLNATE